MRAGVDIGTNTILLVIADGTSVIADVHRIPRLGEGIDADGIISKRSLARAIDVLTEYRDLIKQHNVQHVRAVATSAVRDAKNRDEIVARLEAALQFPIDVIDGETEGALTFRGSVDAKAADTILIDIGGGSTEIVRGAFGVVASSHSIDVGVVRFNDRYGATRPFPKDAQRSMRAAIRQALAENILRFGTIARVNEAEVAVVAVAGTPTSLAMLDMKLESFDETAINGYVLRNERTSALSVELLNATMDELYQLRGIDHRRADVLPVGAVILNEILSFLDAQECTVSTKGLRYGAMITSK